MGQGGGQGGGGEAGVASTGIVVLRVVEGACERRLGVAFAPPLQHAQAEAAQRSDQRHADGDERAWLGLGLGLGLGHADGDERAWLGLGLGLGHADGDERAW